MIVDFLEPIEESMANSKLCTCWDEPNPVIVREVNYITNACGVCDLPIMCPDLHAEIVEENKESN